MQPSWKFYLSGIILTLHKIRKYMPTFEGTPRPTDPKISFIRKSAHQLIGKWCQRNYRSHLRPQGKTRFLQPRAVPLYLPDRCQHDKQPNTQTWVRAHTRAHETREEPTEDSRLSARQSKEGGWRGSWESNEAVEKLKGKSMWSWLRGLIQQAIVPGAKCLSPTQLPLKLTGPLSFSTAGGGRGLQGPRVSHAARALF